MALGRMRSVMLRVLKPRVVAPPAFSVSKTYKEREERGGRRVEGENGGHNEKMEKK